MFWIWFLGSNFRWRTTWWKWRCINLRIKSNSFVSELCVCNWRSRWSSRTLCLIGMSCHTTTQQKELPFLFVTSISFVILEIKNWLNLRYYLSSECDEESDLLSHSSKSLIAEGCKSDCFSSLSFSRLSFWSHEWHVDDFVSLFWGSKSFSFSLFRISTGVCGKVPQALRNLACRITIYS